MTPRDQIFADFFKAYRVTDEKMREALEKAAASLQGEALTIEALERLWYSRDISWLRHGKPLRAKEKEE